MVIKSANSDTTLELKDPQGHYCQVRVTAHDHPARKRVYMYRDGPHLGSLFRAAAADWRGWNGERCWKSVDGELAVSLEADGLGHVTVSVSLGDELGDRPDPWCLQTTLTLEAGQLDRVARDAETFFAK